MLTYILIGVGALVALFAVIVTLQPSGFRISRSATMAAAPAAAFAQVNDFHNWRAWSPWEGIDPALQRTYEGPESGPGAVYSWVGNKNVGEGRMTILESKPGESVKIKLDFIKPFAATNTALFTFQPQANQTDVTWTMEGEKTCFFAKAMHLCINMDKMIGGNFEQGLAKMKSLVEQERR